MLAITGHKGFQMTFQNGWAASVQFGPGNYCECFDAAFGAPGKTERWESSTAQVVAWPAKGGLVDLGDGDTVRGWLSADQVLAFLNWVAGIEHSLPMLEQALEQLKEAKQWLKS